MSNTITLTVELGPKTQEKLDLILTTLQKVGAHNCDKCVQSAVAMTRDLAEQAEAARAGAPATEAPNPETVHPVDAVSPHGVPEPVAEPAAEPAAEPEPEAPKWTKNDIRAKVRQVATPGSAKWDKAREIVKSYAENVDRVPEDKYAEVMDRLTALEKED